MHQNEADKKPETAIIQLDEPILRGTKEITEVIIRRPKAGALRGASLVDLMNINVTALQMVLPRITEPALTQHDIANMDPSDLAKMGMEVSFFLAPKADRAMVSPSK